VTLTKPANVRRVLRPTAIIAGVWATASLALLAGGLLPPLPSGLAWLALPSCGLVAIALLSWCCSAFSRAQEPAFSELGWLRRVMLLACVGVAGGLYLTRPADSGSGLLTIAASTNLLVFALLVGNAMVKSVRKPSELVPVCIVMSLADLFSVFAGPSRQMVATIDAYYRSGRVGPPPLSDLLLVKIPIPGFDYPVPIFGVADLIILAFLIAAARKFRLDDNLAGSLFYLPAAAVGLAAALLLAQLSNLFLPALPLVALVFLAGTLPRHPAMRQLRQTEWIAVIVSATLLVGMGVVGATAL